MQTLSHRSFFLFLVIITMMTGVASCDKSEDFTPPSISLLGTGGAVTEDGSAAMGDTIYFHIKATQGTEKLISFRVLINGQVAKDSTFSSTTFDIMLYKIKGADTLEEFQFIIRDRESREASATVKVTLEGGISWGPITSHNDIALGAQNHGTNGGFFSLADGAIRDLADAFQNQGIIDLLYYYEAGDDHTIASPGANLSSSIFTGPYALSQWATLRTTRFKKINITAQDFQGCSNDSLLIAAYGTTEGNRKAKNLLAGQYYSFLTDSNKTGIIFVKSIVGTDSGTIVLDLKYQQ